MLAAAHFRQTLGFPPIDGLLDFATLLDHTVHVPQIPGPSPGTRVPSLVVLPAINRWLCDTGCPFDLISRHDVERMGLESCIYRVKHPVHLVTANDDVRVREMIKLVVPGTDETIDALVLKAHAPPVLSVGKRVMQGWSFGWEMENK